MAGLTYTTFVSSIANLIPTPVGDVNFQSVLPNIIDDAEQRLYRELDLLNTSIQDSSGALTAGNRNFLLPTTIGVYLVTDEINVITPAGITDPELGTRVGLVPTTEEALNVLFPSVIGSGVPAYYAMRDQGKAVLGPWPNANYQVEVVGTQRPTPLSQSNVTTLLSAYFPDLMVAAGMVFTAAYMKNFGAAVDDPKMATSWESHLQTLLQSAKTEEDRKNFTGPGWSGKDPSPLATPPRT